MTTTDSQHLSQEQLSSLVDERLEPAERGRAEEHLVGCTRCSNDLLSLRATVRLLRGLPEVEPPRSFVLAETARVPLALRLVPWARAAGTMAAALFVVLVSADLLGLTGTGSGPTVPAAPGLSEAPAAAKPATAKPAAAPAASPAAGRSAADAPAPAAVPAAPAAPAGPAAEGAAPARPAEAARAAAPPPAAAPAPGAPAAEGAAPQSDAAAPSTLRSVAPTPLATPASALPPGATSPPLPAPGAAGGLDLRPWELFTALLAIILVSASVLMSRLARRAG